MENELGHPLRDGLSSQAMEPQASPPKASIPDAWQPIETAPKVEDQWVLLFGPDGVDVGEYNKYCKNWQRVRTAEYDNDGCDITPPTHWMPLPTPPNNTPHPTHSETAQERK